MKKLKGMLIIRPDGKSAPVTGKAELEYNVANALSSSPTERFKQLNEFLKLAATFKKVKKNWPTGVFKFKTFKDADKWRFKIITGANRAC
ncbi:hypothetical protein KKF70_06755 [bacterium]|nr:hypothetical protein [bacterium]